MAECILNTVLAKPYAFSIYPSNHFFFHNVYSPLVKMQNLGVEPSSSTYNGLLRAVVKDKGSEAGIELVRIFIVFFVCVLQVLISDTFSIN